MPAENLQASEYFVTSLSATKSILSEKDSHLIHVSLGKLYLLLLYSFSYVSVLSSMTIFFQLCFVVGL